MFATIDIGTNSVLLLLGDPLPDGGVRVICDLMRVTRLGEGLGQTGVIADAAVQRTLDALGAYGEICAQHGVSRVAAVGTAALRTAKNAADVLARIKNASGLDVEVISDEREAALTYHASARDFGSDIVVVDIGGGSTEFVAERRRTRDEGREGESDIVATSLPVGCVALTERFLKSDPETNDEVFHLRREVHEAFERNLDPELYARPHDRTLVATAGTATTLMAMHLRLASYASDRVHGRLLKIDELRDLIDAMRPKTIAERRELPGLDPSRADVILAGAELLREAMSFLGYSGATISDRGVRWGLFYDMFCS